jgi:asparagine N-glycosylation enzyme membrane subunit Stt3
MEMTSHMTTPDDGASMPTSDRKVGRRHDLGLTLAIFTAAALVRATSWKDVLTPEGVIFTDPDSYSHMWRIWNSVSRSIPLSARDPFVNFPHGGEVLWSPAFDWILATCIRLLGLDQPTAELFCAWVPLVLGAAAVALAALVASRTFSLSAGWIAGLMLALLPGSFNYTQFGFLDHHSAITLIGTAMLGGAIWIVSRGDDAPRLWPIGAGTLVAFALLTWAGALLHVGILQIALLTWALLAASLERASARTLRLALAHVIAAVLILPFSLREWEVFGNFNPLALTRFQSTFYAAGAITLVAAAFLWRRPMFGRTRFRRVLSAAVVALAGLAVAFLCIPDLATILDDSAGWFSDDAEFLGNIIELKPLFSSDQRSVWWRPIHILSPLFFLFPLALIAIGWRRPRPERWVLLFWTGAFSALTLDQYRFVNTFSVAYSIIWGGALACLFGWIGERIASRPVRIGVQGLVAIAVAMSVLVPAVSHYAPRLRGDELSSVEPRREARRAIARWLAKSRPPPLDEQGNPTSGLLCVWSAGHEFRYYSGWAVHQDSFGPYVSPENVEVAEDYFREFNEDRAVERLERLRTRYVVADRMGAGHPPYPIGSMAQRLVESAGSGSESPGGPDVPRHWLGALTRHRLLFAWPNGQGGAWLYEVVPGATIMGASTPGTLVTVEVALRTPSGHPRRWTTRRRVDESGTFRIRVPYATVGMPESGFMPRGPYLLRTRDGSVELDVSEVAVQTGATIEAPRVDQVPDQAEGVAADERDEGKRGL